MPHILLVDNGSKRPEATLALRELAAKLQMLAGRPVAPVSLQHADSISATALGGTPAWVFNSYLRRQLELGYRDFLVVPLFFGQSRALTRFIPDQIGQLRSEVGDLDLKVAPPLCPLPQGEPRLVDILRDHLDACTRAEGVQPEKVFVVDHGSPVPEVTAVRNWLATELDKRSGAGTPVATAAMERRAGKAYDFAGPLLAEALADHAAAHPRACVAIAMQFLSAGRHAGPDGDIAAICRSVQQRFPGYRIMRSALMGSHPTLPEILMDRLDAIAGSCPDVGTPIR